MDSPHRHPVLSESPFKAPCPICTCPMDHFYATATLSTGRAVMVDAWEECPACGYETREDADD